MATLGDQAVGSIVKLNVNGVATKFKVIHQGIPSSIYDSSCDGTWLLKTTSQISMNWDSTNNDYENSDVHSYLNTTFINLLDDDIKKCVRQVKIPYRAGYGNSTTVSSGANGLSTKAFLLSPCEVGYYNYVDVKDGAALSIAGTDFISGTFNWWLRSPVILGDSSYSRNTAAYTVENYSGTIYSLESITVTASHSVLPALILEPNLTVDDSGKVIVKSFSGYANIGGVNKEMTGGYVNVGGVWKEIKNMYMNVNGGSTAILPSGYTKVEYLESSGTQYIDTGFKHNQSTRVVADFECFSGSVHPQVFGASGSSYGNSLLFLGYKDLSKFLSYYNGTRIDYEADISGRHTIDANKNIFTLDNETVIASFDSATFTSSFNMYLFAYNNNGTATNLANVRIYSCQIYDNGTLIRDFIPCLNSSGTAGLYDTVNGVFYTNAGSGTFAVGQTVGADGGIWRQMAQ